MQTWNFLFIIDIVTVRKRLISRQFVQSGIISYTHTTHPHPVSCSLVTLGHLHSQEKETVLKVVEVLVVVEVEEMVVMVVMVCGMRMLDMSESLCSVWRTERSGRRADWGWVGRADQQRHVLTSSDWRTVRTVSPQSGPGLSSSLLLPSLVSQHVSVTTSSETSHQYYQVNWQEFDWNSR